MKIRKNIKFNMVFYPHIFLEIRHFSILAVISSGEESLDKGPECKVKCSPTPTLQTRILKFRNF